MVADDYSTFVNMFIALGASWDECNDETLAEFLSEAIPYTFGGKGSADSTIWSEFSSTFAARFPSSGVSVEDAHGFAKDYLAGITDEYSKVYPGKKRLVDAFEDVAPPARWVEVFEPQEA